MHDRSHRGGQGARSPQPALDAPRPAGVARDSLPAAPSRRRFLFALGASGAAALGSEAGAAAAAVATPVAATAAGNGYRETEHVRRYYASARN